MKIKNLKYMMILVLLVASLMSSIILSTQKTSEICDITEGCSVVHHSQYNYTFGIQNSHYGVFVFTILTILAFSYIQKPTKSKKILIQLGIFIGAFIAIYFIYIQHFVLGAYCKYCLVVDFSMVISLGLILFWKDKNETKNSE